MATDHASIVLPIVSNILYIDRSGRGIKNKLSDHVEFPRICPLKHAEGILIGLPFGGQCLRYFIFPSIIPLRIGLHANLYLFSSCATLHLNYQHFVVVEIHAGPRGIDNMANRTDARSKSLTPCIIHPEKLLLA